MTAKTAKTDYLTADGLRVYDLDVYAGELVAVAGPDGATLEDLAAIDTEALPDGWRWVEGEEWETICEAHPYTIDDLSWTGTDGDQAPAGYSVHAYFDEPIPTRFSASWFAAHYLGADEDGIGLELLDCEDPPTRYEIRDDSGWSEEITADSMGEACDLARDMCDEGDWPAEGASVEISVAELDEDGEQVYVESFVHDIEPDHAKLIRAAAGLRIADICGADPDDHDWTSEGEGGCSENPGVWSIGGTAFEFRAHCRRCGLRRTTRTTGPQRNPGDHDTAEYSLDD